MRIAVFDSGIGGLTVLRQALTALPDDVFLYYADTRNAPYGVKPKAEVAAHVLAAADFLADRQIDALVVACNTATAVAIQALRARFPFPVIGMEPAVKPALEQNTGKKIMVFATSLTLRASKLDTLISNLGQGHNVSRRALDRLVTFAEAFEFDTPDLCAYLDRVLADVPWHDYESVVLGCTHFLFYRRLIQARVGLELRVLDGNQGTVNQLARVLHPLRPRAPALPTSPRVTFYASGAPETPARVTRMLALLSSSY
ncbi:MAG: glutamate racemase [Kiritimatiellia bacterium]|nr:glutamate racemase [Kiritimatiellia bacterium]